MVAQTGRDDPGLRHHADLRLPVRLSLLQPDGGVRLPGAERGAAGRPVRHRGQSANPHQSGATRWRRTAPDPLPTSAVFAVGRLPRRSILISLQ